ncbi:hypothetical protein LEP1GSC089_0082, partial [Leptospira interrogans serovar Autumnalis str. LP101]
YVDGNPVSYRDPSGHISGPDMMHMLNRIVGHAMGKDFHNGNSPSFSSIGKDLHRNALSKGINKSLKKIDTFLGKSDIGRFINKGWRDIRRGDLGRGFDKYIGKDGILGYAGDHLITAPLKNMAKARAKDKIERNANHQLGVEFELEILISLKCNRQPDFQYATQGFFQTKAMSSLVSKYGANNLVPVIFYGQSLSNQANLVINVLPIQSSISRYMHYATEANCE